MGTVTNVAMLIDGLRARGAKFTVADGKLVVDAPKGVIASKHLEILRTQKAQIVRLLTEPASESKHSSRCPGPAKCQGCYEVSPGVWLHPPKASEDWAVWLQKWQPKGKTLQ